jgi:hypothetical protein
MILHHPTRIGDQFCDLASVEGFDITADGLGCCGRATLYTGLRRVQTTNRGMGLTTRRSRRGFVAATELAERDETPFTLVPQHEAHTIQALE